MNRRRIDWGIVALVVIAEFSWLGLDFLEGVDQSQIYAKGAFYCLLGFVALIRLVRRKVISPSLGDYLFLLFLLWALVSSVYSPDPFLTFSTAASSLAVYLYVRTAPVDSSPLQSAYLGLLVTIVASAVAYLLAPHQFSLNTWYGGVRVRGILGNPNGLGRAAAALIVYCIVYKELKLTVFEWGCALLAVTLLLASGSRGSLGFLLLVLLIISITKLLKRAYSAWGPLFTWGLFLIIVSASLPLLLLVIVWAQRSFQLLEYAFATSISRSGSATEIWTLNDRTLLWQFVLDMILKRPLLGYGYRAGQVIIPSMWTNEYGLTYPHAHNMYLEVALSLGIPALLLFVTMFLWLIVKNARCSHRAAQARLALTLLTAFVGLLERSAVGSVTMFFVLMCVLIADTGSETLASGRALVR